MKLLQVTPQGKEEQTLLMDRAYEGDRMRSTAVMLNYTPVVPPKKTRTNPWEYDKELVSPSGAETQKKTRLSTGFMV